MQHREPQWRLPAEIDVLKDSLVRAGHPALDRLPSGHQVVVRHL
jgi:hypothetical protein